MTLNRPRTALILASALALVFLGAADGRAVPCPTTVTFEGTFPEKSSDHAPVWIELKP